MEERLLSQHPDWSYRKFAYNRFVVVGPVEDPARIASASDVIDAFQRIVGLWCAVRVAGRSVGHPRARRDVLDPRGAAAKW